MVIKCRFSDLEYTKQMPEQKWNKPFKTAVCSGYRLIDTASVYKNEDGVGRGLKALDVPREELFITTKIWNNAQRLGDVEDSFNRSLERLGLDYVDLYLIHWAGSRMFHKHLENAGKITICGENQIHRCF